MPYNNSTSSMYRLMQHSRGSKTLWPVVPVLAGAAASLLSQSSELQKDSVNADGTTTSRTSKLIHHMQSPLKSFLSFHDSAFSRTYCDAKSVATPHKASSPTTSTSTPVLPTSATKTKTTIDQQPLILSKEPRLDQKVCVITGASRGLGQAIAIQLVREGAKVVLVDFAKDANETLDKIQRLLENSEETQLTVKDVALFCRADISNPDQVEQAIQTAVTTFGPRIDVLVNNACRFVFETVETASVQDWQDSMNVNILGHALVTQACLPYMKHAASGEMPAGYGPSIIFQGSISSFRGQPGCATYATMKGAIVQLARNCAYDFAKYNIRVNSLCAGTIETPISQTERAAHGWSFDEWERLKTQDVFLQRVGTPYEIAKAAVFLASTDSSYTSGEHLMVDGGAAACTVMQR